MRTAGCRFQYRRSIDVMEKPSLCVGARASHQQHRFQVVKWCALRDMILQRVSETQAVQLHSHGMQSPRRTGLADLLEIIQ